jgi:hypothetical protein
MVSKLSKNESSVKRNQKGFETNLFAKRKKREFKVAEKYAALLFEGFGYE